MARLDRTGLRKVGMVAMVGLGAACGSAALGTGDSGSTTSTTTSTTAGMGGSRSATTSTSSSAVATGAAGVGGGVGGGTGGSAPSCTPPAAAGSLWALSAQQYGLPNPTSMCDYRGDVLLIVNTADV